MSSAAAQGSPFAKIRWMAMIIRAKEWETHSQKRMSGSKHTISSFQIFWGKSYWSLSRNFLFVSLEERKGRKNRLRRKTFYGFRWSSSRYCDYVTSRTVHWILGIFVISVSYVEEAERGSFRMMKGISTFFQLLKVHFHGKRSFAIIIFFISTSYSRNFHYYTFLHWIHNIAFEQEILSKLFFSLISYSFSVSVRLVHT